MIGAIIGDIVGSRFEFDNYRGTDFELFHSADFFTDDTVMSLAVAEAILKSMDTGEDLSALTVKLMKTYGRKYPDCGVRRTVQPMGLQREHQALQQLRQRRRHARQPLRIRREDA